MTTFKSKIDTWFKIVHWGTLTLLLIVAISLVFAPENSLVMMILFGLLIGATAIVMIWGYYQTDYTFDGELLKVRYGIMRWKIPIRKIERVYPSKMAWSGPALSLDRLAIKMIGSKLELYISPEDKEGFLQALMLSDEALQLQHDEVNRR